MKLKKVNEEVFYADSEIITLNKETISDLEKLAQQTTRKRSRICTHKDSQDILQEMFIIHYKETYVRPHYHSTKTESFHVISGEADVLLFDSEGKLQERIALGEFQSGKSFYYRIGPNTIHCLIIKSDVFVFHESTLGPFNREETHFPDWAPSEEQNPEAALAFMKKYRK